MGREKRKGRKEADGNWDGGIRGRDGIVFIRRQA